MPQHPISDDVLQRLVDTIAECGSKAEAARQLNQSVNTLKSRLEMAQKRGISARVILQKAVDADLLQIIKNLRSELEESRASLRIASKPHFTVRSDTSQRSGKIRVVCIGDAHDSPDIQDKSRFRWISNYIRKEKPDLVIQIGDFATLDSLNTHCGNETYGGKSKPTFIADMVSFNNALGEMDLDGIEHHVTLGNHERRLYLFEERAPEAYGMMQCELQKVLERHKWTQSPYGAPYVVGGVSFVHCALNSLGKSFGGKNAEGTIANDAVGDWVIGHSHRERMHRAPKLGANNYVKIINVGCALPNGHIEEYAKHTLTGWSFGITDMVIQHGHVQDYRFVTMEHLSETYG
jgi:transposase-like protein